MKQSHFLVIILALVVGIDASAQKKKTTVGDVLKKAQESSRGGKLQQTQKSNTLVPDSKITFESVNRQSVNLTSVKPPKSTEMLNNSGRSGNEIEYEKTLDKQISELFKLTQKFSKNPARGELWLRLAELYVEKASLVDMRKQDLYDKQLKVYLEGKTKTKPKLDTAEARQYNKKAVQLYEWFLKEYPKDEKQSQALFFLGYNSFELGEMDKGLQYYSELTKRYPNSMYVWEAYFALGEFYFENEKWVEAYKEYSQIVKRPKHRLHIFAMYKSAWSLFRMGRTEDAIKYMDYIIKNKGNSSGAEGSGKTVNKSKLEVEAARDIVVFFADVGDTQRAINYFNQNVSPEARNSALEKLGYYYSDKGNREAARDIFRNLIESNPNSKKSFEYQYQIVQNYFYAKNSPQFKEELYRWITDYSKSSSWQASNNSDKAFIENSYKLREQTLRNYILQQHQTAQNSRAKFSQNSALEGYKLYFQEFADSPQVADMHFFYGELLYDMNRFDEAGQQYAWVVERAPQNKFAAKSGQNLLLAVERAVPKDEELQKRIGDSIEPIPLDPRVEKFLQSAKWYLQKFPNSERDAEIRFKTGRLYYQTNHFTEAEAIFKEIIQKHPKTKYSEYSANLLLDIYNLKKDYEGLSKVGTELLTNESISTSQAGSDIRGVLEKANFKKAQDLEVEKNYLKSAEQFEIFAKQNPKSDLAFMALYNSAINYERSGENYKAAQNYQKILVSDDKKADNYKANSKKLLAKLYQNAGRLQESSKLFEEIAAANPKDSLVANYYYNAAIMYDTIGENNNALRNYNEFLKVSKNFRDRLDATYSQAEIYKRMGSRTFAIERYKEYVNSAPDDIKKVLALDALINLDKRSVDEIPKYKARINSIHRRLSGEDKAKAAAYVAKYKYEEVLLTYNELVRIRIPANPSKQKEAVNQKLEMITRLNKELADVIKLDSADEIIKSINLLGEANEHMGNAIMNTPLPPELGEEQKKVYLVEIKKIADPFFAKANESFKLAVDRARDLSVYNDAYKNAYQKMSTSSPVEYYNKGEVTQDSRLLNWMGE